jgi:hypothetical protein
MKKGKDVLFFLGCIALQKVSISVRIVFFDGLGKKRLEKCKMKVSGRMDGDWKNKTGKMGRNDVRRGKGDEKRS